GCGNRAARRGPAENDAWRRGGGPQRHGGHRQAGPLVAHEHVWELREVAAVRGERSQLPGQRVQLGGRGPRRGERRSLGLLRAPGKLVLGEGPGDRLEEVAQRGTDAAARVGGLRRGARMLLELFERGEYLIPRKVPRPLDLVPLDASVRLRLEVERLRRCRVA